MDREKQGNYDIKRGNYFQGMMLVDKDFKDEQNYHQQMRHNHNLEMHTWGVVRGLKVSTGAGGAMSVGEGLAIDANGKEIWWSGGDPKPAGSAAEGSYLVIEWNEVFIDDYPQMAGMKLRVIDTSKFSWKRAKGDNDVVLAVLSQGQPDNSLRRYAGSLRANQNNIEIRPLTKDGSLHLMTGAELKERLTIDSSGNVGIGTTSPKALLHVGQNDGKENTPRAPIILSRYWGTDTDTRAVAIYNYFNSTTKNDQLVFGVSGEGSNYKSPALYENAKMVIQGNGNVGIGTVTPGDYKLDVAGKVKATQFDGSLDAARITGKLTAAQIPDLKDIAGLLPPGKISDQWIKSGSNIYYGTPNVGNVGIGLTNPQNPLEVKGNVAIRVPGVLKFLDENGTSYPDNWIGVATNIDSTSKWLHIGGITDASARRLVLSADRTYISGKVGIGTFAPAGDLHIRRDATEGIGPTLLIQNGGGGGRAEARIDIATYTYDFNDTAPNFRLRVIDDGAVGAHVDISTKLPGRDVKAGLLSRLYIRSDGNVGIGTNDPQQKLHVDGSVKVKNEISCGGVNAELPGHVFWRPYSATDGTVYFHAYVNDRKPRDTRFAFRVRGNDKDADGEIQRGFGAVCVLDREGIWGNQKGTSDIRLKKDVSYLVNQSNPTDKLLSLRGVRFRWDNDNEDAPYQLGLIAQEVEKVFPELVSTGGDGFKGISILGMFAPVIEAIRQQHQEIEDLRAQIVELETNKGDTNLARTTPAPA
jgi:hypothetical protein